MDGAVSNPHQQDSAEDPKILVVDDELANLQKLRRTFIHRYPVLSASSAQEAISVVENHNDIAVIIADQRMPEMTGVEFLQWTLAPLPHAIRIILTGFTDVEVLMHAINTCKVFRYIVKPWDPPDLLMTVERGLETHRLAVENELYKRELVRRERLSRELEIAREIQRYILPPRYPELENYEMGIEYHPAREVGGDLYDFECDAKDETMQLVIGDVSGKSIPAALYGAVFSGQMRSLFAYSGRPADTLAFLNASLISRYPVNNYVAVAQLNLDLENGIGLLANGGMPFPYLVRGREIKRLEVAGLPLGLLGGTTYDELRFGMEPGDVLVMISDGVTDAMNPRGEMYDEARLMESLRVDAQEPTADYVKSIYRKIVDFIEDAEVHDDITILALRRKQEAKG